MGIVELPEDEAICEINLTPLVDVSLVLVIIFMVIAPFFSHVLKPLILPSSSKAALTESAAIQVSVFPDGTLAVGSAEVPFERLEAALRKELDSGKPPWMVIRAGEDVSHGRVMDVLKTGKRMGINRLGFAAKPKPAEALSR